MGIPNQIRPRNRDPITRRKKQGILPIAPAEIEEDDDGIFVPSRIAENEILLSQWNFLIENARRLGCYSPAYAMLYEQTTLTVTKLRTEWALLEEEGTVLTRYGKNGTACGTMLNPRAAYVSTLQRNLMGMVNQLGLSPRAVQYVLNFDPSSGKQDNNMPVPEVSGDKPKAGTVVLFR
jgi:hypothetical protein